jgi:hypothetical protein
MAKKKAPQISIAALSLDFTYPYAPYAHLIRPVR